MASKGQKVEFPLFLRRRDADLGGCAAPAEAAGGATGQSSIREMLDFGIIVKYITYICSTLLPSGRDGGGADGVVAQDGHPGAGHEERRPPALQGRGQLAKDLVRMKSMALFQPAALKHHIIMILA